MNKQWAVIHTSDPQSANTKERQQECVEDLIEQGQLSRVAKLLHSPGLVPGNMDTLHELIDPTKRPQALSQPIADEVLNYVPELPKVLSALENAMEDLAKYQAWDGEHLAAPYVPFVSVPLAGHLEKLLGL